jgi:hypothetical protein
VLKLLYPNAATKLALYSSPRFTASLKDSRLWSLDWVQQNGVAGPFHFVLCLKVEGGYSLLGEYATATEAFAARRELVASTGTTAYFLRAVRVRPVVADTGEDLDCFRDALRTGDESLVPASLRSEYKAWAAMTVAKRGAYRAASQHSF